MLEIQWRGGSPSLTHRHRVAAPLRTPLRRRRGGASSPAGAERYRASPTPASPRTRRAATRSSGLTTLASKQRRETPTQISTYVKHELLHKTGGMGAKPVPSLLRPLGGGGLQTWASAGHAKASAPAPIKGVRTQMVENLPDRKHGGPRGPTEIPGGTHKPRELPRGPRELQPEGCPRSWCPE